MTYLKKYITGSNISGSISRTKIQNTGAVTGADSSFTNKQTINGVANSSYISLPTRIVTANTTALASDYTIICEGSTSTVTLPSNANLKGQIIHIFANKGQTVAATTYSATYNLPSSSVASTGTTIYLQSEAPSPSTSYNLLNYSGVTITSTSPFTLTDNNQNFSTSWVGYVVVVGTSYAVITSATSTVLTFSGGWVGPQPSSGSPYWVFNIQSQVQSTTTAGGVVSGTSITSGTVLNSKFFYIGISNSAVTLRPDGTKTFTVPSAQATLTTGQYVAATAYDKYNSTVLGHIEGAVTVSGNDITITPTYVEMPTEISGSSTATSSTSLTDSTQSDYLANQFAQTHMVRSVGSIGVVTANTASDTNDSTATKFTVAAWLKPDGTSGTTPVPTTPYELNLLSNDLTSGIASATTATSLTDNGNGGFNGQTAYFPVGPSTDVSTTTLTDGSASFNYILSINYASGTGSTVTYTTANNPEQDKTVKVGQSITVANVTSSPAGVFNLTGTVQTISGQNITINSTATGTYSSGGTLTVNNSLTGLVVSTLTSVDAITIGTIASNTTTQITLTGAGWSNGTPASNKTYKFLATVTAVDSTSMTDSTRPSDFNGLYYDFYNGWQINSTSSSGATSARITNFAPTTGKFTINSWSNGTPIVGKTYTISWNTSYPTANGQWAGTLVKAYGSGPSGLTITSRTSAATYTLTDTTDNQVNGITGVTIPTTGVVKYNTGYKSATSGGIAGTIDTDTISVYTAAPALTNVTGWKVGTILTLTGTMAGFPSGATIIANPSTGVYQLGSFITATIFRTTTGALTTANYITGGNPYLVGDIVTTAGITPTAFNQTDQIVTQTDPSGLWFIINNPATGTYSSGGTATRYPFITNAYVGYKVRAIGTSSKYTYNTISANSTTVLTLGTWSNGIPAALSAFDIIADYSYATVTSNTTNQLNFSSWAGGTPPATANYYLLTTPANSASSNWVITADNISLDISPSPNIVSGASISLGGVNVLRTGTDLIDGSTSFGIVAKSISTFQNDGSTGWVKI